MAIEVKKAEEIVEKNFCNQQEKEVIQIILSAINDWPSTINTFEEYENEINKFISGTTTKANIEESLRKIDYIKDSWKAESLSQVVEIFLIFSGNKTLKEIIEILGNEISTSSDQL